MVLGTPVPMSLPLSMPRPRVLFSDPHPVPTASSLTASPWSTSQGLCLLPLSRVLVPSPLLCCDVYSPVCPPATFPGPALPKPPINPPHQPQPATCWALHQTLRDDRNSSALTPWIVKLRLLMPPAEVSRPLWTWGARAQGVGVNLQMRTWRPAWSITPDRRPPAYTKLYSLFTEAAELAQDSVEDVLMVISQVCLQQSGQCTCHGGHNPSSHYGHCKQHSRSHFLASSLASI